MANIKDFFKKMDRNSILIGVAVLAILITGVLIFAKSSSGFSVAGIFGKSNSQIAKDAVDYINKSGLTTTPASLVSVSETSGLVKVKIKIGSNQFDSYVTKDEKLLLPQAFEMNQKKETAAAGGNQPTAQQQAQAAASVKKTNSPMLEAFVVARCPFGLQMQRAIADAVKNIPSLAQYVKVRYIGDVSGNTITSMHGDAEAKENMRQICIREEQPAKYWNYVACQMKSGDTAGCETSTGVDSGKLNSCVSDTSRGLAYAKEDFALGTKYGVSGSPTLILNGASISESSFGGRSSDGVKSMVCSGFTSKAGFCSTKLNTAEAAASFSPTYASSTANTGSTGGAGCQAAQ